MTLNQIKALELFFSFSLFESFPSIKILSSSMGEYFSSDKSFYLSAFFVFAIAVEKINRIGYATAFLKTLVKYFAKCSHGKVINVHNSEASARVLFCHKLNRDFLRLDCGIALIFILRRSWKFEVVCQRRQIPVVINSKRSNEQHNKQLRFSCLGKNFFRALEKV